MAQLGNCAEDAKSVQQMETPSETSMITLDVCGKKVRQKKFICKPKDF